MKGISPLVASVLLIAITMAVAAVLANFVSSYTQRTLSALPTCIGGSVNYVTADYPKWDSANGRIIAALEAQTVALGSFRFEVQFQNDSISTYSDSQGLQLAPGASGTAISQTIGGPSSAIKVVRVGTNCSNVRTDFASLK